MLKHEAEGISVDISAENEHASDIERAIRTINSLTGIVTYLAHFFDELH